MSNNIFLKKSSVADKVPLAGDLQFGELALNYADGNLFYKNSSNVVTTLASNKFVSVTGNITGGNIAASGNASITGNVNIGGSSSTTITSFTFGYFDSEGPYGWYVMLTGAGGTLGLTAGQTVTLNFDTGAPITVTLTDVTYVDGNGELLISWGATAPSGTSLVSIVTSTTAISSLSATGNITGSYFIGNGSALTGVTATAAPAGNTTEIQYNAAGSLGASANLTFNGTTLSVIGNISGGNITGANAISATTFSATGNVTGNYFVGNGSQLTGISAGAVTTFSSSPPGSPAQGDIWIDADTGVQYIYFNDDTSSQWAEMEASVSISSGAAAPSSPSNTYTLTGTTTGNVETEIFVDGIANSRISVPTDTSSFYTIDISCRRTNGTDFAAFTLKALASNAGNTVTDIGSVYEIVVARTDVSIAVDARADDANNSVGVYVTGVTGKTFDWKAVVTTVEV